jgi:hypothetical protein
MLVPALITVIGEKSWWPSALAKREASAEPLEERTKEPV